MSEDRMVKVIKMLLHGDENEKKVTARLYPKIADALSGSGLYLIGRFLEDTGVHENGCLVMPVIYKGVDLNLEITVKKK